MVTFDLMRLDDVRCGCGAEYVYPPAIESGTSVSAWCPEDEQEGPTIDDFHLYCRACSLYVSLSFGACPNDPSHVLVKRDDC